MVVEVMFESTLPFTHSVIYYTIKCVALYATAPPCLLLFFDKSYPANFCRKWYERCQICILNITITSALLAINEISCWNPFPMAPTLGAAMEDAIGFVHRTRARAHEANPGGWPACASLLLLKKNYNLKMQIKTKHLQ